MQLEFSRQIFEKYWGRTDGWTDMKPIVAFHNFTNALRQIVRASFRTSFLWCAVLKCGNKDYTSEIAGGRRGHDFPSFSCERDMKESSGMFGNRRAIGHTEFFFLIRIEILHTIHSFSQSYHAPGLGYSFRSNPYYPVPPQVSGFELSVVIIWRYCLFPFVEPEKPPRGFSWSLLLRFWNCLCVFRVKLRNITLRAVWCSLHEVFTVALINNNILKCPPPPILKNILLLTITECPGRVVSIVA